MIAFCATRYAKRCTLAALMWLLAGVWNASGATYYVDAQGGNDGNDGRSPETAWRTIGRVNSAWGALQRGDDVLFRRGQTFTDATLSVAEGAGGTDSNPMVIGAYGAGAKPVIDGSANDLYAGILFWEPDVHYVTVEDLGIRNVEHGISVYTDPVSHLTFSRLDISDVSPGNGIMLLSVDTYVIEDCAISNIGNAGIAIMGSPPPKITNGIIRNNVIHDIVTNDGITLHRDGEDNHIGSNHLLLNNTGYNCAEEAFDITSGDRITIRGCESYNNGNGLMISWNPSNIWIDKCYFHNDRRMGVVVGDSRGVRITSSILENAGYHSLTVGDSSGEGRPSENVSIHNNLIVHSDDASIIDFYSGTSNVDFANNIVVSTHSAASTFVVYVGGTAESTQSTFRNNIWWQEGRSPFNLGQNSRFEDPRWVDIAGRDYRLQSTSSAIDAGVDVGIASDYESNPVYVGAAPDIGAFEYASAGTTYTLSVGGTHGTVTKTPNQSSYTAGATVTVEAIAADGYEFTSWSGDLSGSTNPTIVTMNANKSITANFAEVAPTTYTLSVGGTHGTVTKTPNQSSYTAGATVTVEAIAADGYEFTSWSGDLSGSTNPTIVTMNANKSITANFAEVAPTTYTLSVGGTHGTVTKTPNQSSYTAGATVTVEAIAADGYEFTSWSGDLSGSTNPTIVTMNANKSITANFAEVAPTTYTLSVGGTHGTVTKTPNQSSYTAGATVTVEAIAADGYEFTSWSGDLSGSTNRASITMNSNKSVTAVFTRAIVDDAPPVAVASSPQADAVQVPRNSLVAVRVSDEGEGVDADTVTISIDGATVYSGGGPHYESDAAICRRTGSNTSYTYNYQSEAEFAFGETITVRVNAADLNGNAMSEYVYSFKTEMWAFGGNRRVSWGPEGLDKGHPATASDSDGNLWVVWHAGPAGQRDIYVSRWGRQDDRFAEPTRLTSDAADQANPDIAIGADDKLYVVWQDNRRGNWDICLRTSSNGAAWSAETRITDSDDDQTAPAIAVDNASGCHVAWEDDADGNSDIYVTSSSDGFVSQTAARVTSNTSNQSDPDIAVDASGKVYLVWTDTRSGSGDIYGAVSNNGSWTEVALVTGTGNQYAPALATETAGAWLHLVWVHEAAGGSDVRYAATEGMPASPLVGVDLADDTSGADQLAPTVAVAGRVGSGLKVFVCWQDWRNVTENSQDTDLYLVEVKEADDTNVLVGDGGIGSGQSAPAIGVDSQGFPYVVWTDDRDGNAEVYQAGTTSWDPEVLASQAVTASTGGTVGAAAPSNVDDVSVVIPPAAASQDVTITVTRIQNAPAVPSSGVLSYEFGPSGLQFSQPVTITIPYAVAEFGDEQPTPWWYDSRTGSLSQEGITDIEHVALSPTVAAMRFKTTHFTPYYLISASAMDEIAAGSAGGGCSLSYGNNADPMAYFVPYLLIAFIMAGFRIRDARRRARLR